MSDIKLKLAQLRATLGFAVIMGYDRAKGIVVVENEDSTSNLLVGDGVFERGTPQVGDLLIHQPVVGFYWVSPLEFEEHFVTEDWQPETVEKEPDESDGSDFM